MTGDLLRKGTKQETRNTNANTKYEITRQPEGADGEIRKPPQRLTCPPSTSPLPERESVTVKTKGRQLVT